MRKEGSSTEKDVWFVTRQLFEAVEQGLINPSCAELINEFVVVDRKLLSVARYRSLDIPGSNYLRMCLSWIGRLDLRCVSFERGLFSSTDIIEINEVAEI